MRIQKPVLSAAALSAGRVKKKELQELALDVRSVAIVARPTYVQAEVVVARYSKALYFDAVGDPAIMKLTVEGVYPVEGTHSWYPAGVPAS